jgi:hypothetical protein
MEKNDISQKPDGAYHIREYFTLWIEALEKFINVRFEALEKLINVGFESIQDFINERDKRYQERFTAQESAVSAALASSEKLTNAVSLATEKAITKAEAAQTIYNIGHNDLTRKMDAQYKEMIPRNEHEGDIKNILDKHDELKKEVQEQRDKLYTKDEHIAYMKATDSELREFRDFKITIESKASQSSVNIAYLIAGLGILLSIINLVKSFVK